MIYGLKIDNPPAYVPTKQFEEGDPEPFTHKLINTGTLPDDRARYPRVNPNTTDKTQEQMNHIIAHYRSWIRTGKCRNAFLRHYSSYYGIPTQALKYWLEIC